MDGWFSEAADWASRRNLAWNVWSLRQVGAQRLDRDDPVQPDVACPVHLGHAAAPDDAVEFVAAAE